MSSETDNKLGSLAAGFTLGFGILTVWEAIKQTRSVTSPFRSHYLWMVWGEILSNVAILIIAWLLWDGILVPTPMVLFWALFVWVFEIQLLLQIIVNRTAVIVDDRRMISRIRLGTAILISCVQIIVFCIWIPTHSLNANPIFAQINNIWDPMSKVIILLVDAALNIYFIRSVKQRLVKYHGLKKYAALVTFNTRLMVVSILMDVMIIGLMHLPNPMVYTQFHPVAYMVKLNIEMSMASLIRKIAQASVSEREGRSMGRYTFDYAGTDVAHPLPTLKSGTYTNATSKVRKPSSATSQEHDPDCIRTTKEVQVHVENLPANDGDKDSINDTGVYTSFDRRSHEHGEVAHQHSEDEFPLAP